MTIIDTRDDRHDGWVWRLEPVAGHLLTLLEVEEDRLGKAVPPTPRRLLLDRVS